MISMDFRGLSAKGVNSEDVGSRKVLEALGQLFAPQVPLQGITGTFEKLFLQQYYSMDSRFSVLRILLRKNLFSYLGPPRGIHRTYTGTVEKFFLLLYFSRSYNRTGVRTGVKNIIKEKSFFL